MSEEFYKDSRTDIVEQLNANNTTSITPDNVSLAVVDTQPSVVGDGVKYIDSAPVNLIPRDMAALVGHSPVVLTDLNLSSGTIKVKDLLPEINQAVGTNISAADITNGEDTAPYFPTGGPAVILKLVGNKVSLLDFSVVLVQKDYSRLADWVNQSSGSPVANTGTAETPVYELKPFNSSSFLITATDFATNVDITIGVVGAPIIVLTVDDDDKLGLQWPESVSWAETDVRDFTGVKKVYLLLTQDNGVSYKAMRFNANQSWSDVLYKIQRRLVNDDQIHYLLDGHVQFLKNNTGQFVDPHTDHYVINEKGVLVNNRHFTYNTRQEGQPDSDATTEGHSLLITGFIAAYQLATKRGNATKAAEYLAEAEKYFASYIAAFYAGEAPPDIPGRWSSNWIVNGKGPVLAHYPLAASNDFPTHGGFIDVPITFTNGVALVPAGTPDWGEYLDVVGKVYTGKMGWQRIDATPYATNEDGTLNWSVKGTVYEVESIHTWSKEIITGDGDKTGDFTDSALIGTITLVDKTFNGELNFSYAVRLPVEHGGYMLATNECQHNRPLQVPVNNLYRGNASDAEQWFCETAYDLWQITGNELYQKAYASSKWTIMEYTTIDANDKFFRKVIGDTRYDTDGIAYYYTYPSQQPVVFGRNAEGNITVRSERADGLQITLEQNAIPFRVNRNSILLINYGGVDDNGGAVNMRSQLELSIDKTEANKKTYTIPLGATQSTDMTELRIPIGSLVETTPDDLFELMYASSVSWSENATIVQKFEDNVADGRTAPVMSVVATDDMQLSVSLTKARVISSVTYKSSIDMNIRIIDADGWRWWAMLPTTGDWVTKDIATADWSLSSYQPNHADTDPTPSAPNWGDGVDEVTFLPDGSSVAGDTFEVYSLNGLPTTYAVDDGYTMLFNVTFYLDAPGTVLLGDCTIQGQRLDPLPYTPGIIPFSNNSVPNAPTFDSWRGQPYPGYQYPFYYALQTLEENPNRDLMIQNVIDFWWDSQQWYQQQFGVIGPGASAYVWDRWDMPDGETPNTWTMYHFGTNVAWSGYQPRAFYAAVKMYESMETAGLSIPTKLVEYITNWLTFLKSFVGQNGIVPSDFPVDEAPKPLENDFTGHMSGLYLAGISKAYVLGVRIPGHVELAAKVHQEIVDNYVQRPGYPDIMNGSWSPYADPSNNGKDGMFFGFWAGELMRGLSYYTEMLDEIK